MKTLNFNLLLLFVLFFSSVASAQTGSVKGLLLDEISNEPIPFANIIIKGTTKGTATDFDGNFLIEGIEPGFVQLQISVVGYKPKNFRRYKYYIWKAVQLQCENGAVFHRNE